MQHVKTPTHRCGHVLDLILTSAELGVVAPVVDPPLLSDHSLVIASISVVLPATWESSTRVVREWRKIDIDAFAGDLASSSLFRSPPTDVNAAFESYDDTVRALIDKHVPAVRRRVKSRRDARWFDADSHAAKRKTRRLEKRYPRGRTAFNLAAWCTEFDLQGRLFQSKFVDFWRSVIKECKQHPRQLWRTANLMLHPPAQSSTAPFTAVDLAKHFQDKISAIRNNTANSPPPVVQPRSCPALSSFEPVSEVEMKSILSLCPTKSSALDPIPAWLLKRLHELFVPLLCHLCNLSLDSGVFPSSQKHAIVLPLLKKPTLDPDSLNSYRPISNLSFVSKVLERGVSRRLVTHINTYQLLPARQSAYRRHFSTETAVLCVHNDTVRAIDNGLATGLVLLDLSSAFDTVDHSILLSVLNNRFYVSETALHWFESYLLNRTQSFLFAGEQTAPAILDCGVPQGSVLGPFEFICYTEDVCSVFDRHGVKHHMFADDKQIYKSGKTDNVNTMRQVMTDCSSDIATWCASRRLQLNGIKSDVIWFGSRSMLTKLAGADLSITVGSDKIQPSSVIRDLGVQLDEELSMKQHINILARSCFHHIRRLRQVRRLVGDELTIQLVLALVVSRLDYFNSVLAGLPASTVAPLQRV